MALIPAIGGGPVALDTAVFIYLIERHPRFLPVIEPMFREIDAGRLRAVTSALTLLETLAVPFRSGDRDLASRYETILSNSRGLTLAPVDTAVLRLAAEIRGRTGTRTPDAIQLATALLSGCSAFVTNDQRIPALPGLIQLQLEDFALAG